MGTDGKGDRAGLPPQDLSLGNALRELAQSTSDAEPDFTAMYATVSRRRSLRIAARQRSLRFVPLAAAAVFAVAFGIGNRFAGQGAIAEKPLDPLVAAELASFAVGDAGGEEPQGIDVLLGDYVESLWTEPSNI